MPLPRLLQVPKDNLHVKNVINLVYSWFSQKSKVLVEGVNVRTHHEKPSQENQQGGRVNKEASIHVSNVMVVDPTTDEPTRIGRKQVEENGKTRWVRYSKKSGELIDK